MRRGKKCKDCKKELTQTCIDKIMSRCFKCTWKREREKKQKQLLRAKVKRIRKQNSVSVLKKKLDVIFSIFIRLRDKGICFTCGIQKPYKEMQNGHYEPRSHMGTRYCEINCNAQCYACNVAKKGNYTVYARKLIELHGVGILDILAKKRNTVTKYTSDWYLASIQFYNEKVKELKQ